MSHSATKPAVQFFDTQFRRQLAGGECELNPFESAILPHVAGRVLDLGCGLGQLSILAARAGCTVDAFDGADSAVDSLNERARREGLPIRARAADLENATIDGQYDSIVCIGLLMFFSPPAARRWLDQIINATAPGGMAAVNVLIEGTTYLDMFDPQSYTLFGENELDQTFRSWDIMLSEKAQFDAPRGTVKRFATVVARRPAD